MKYQLSTLFCFLLVLALNNANAQTDFPQASISNGIIKARIYLPDAEKGYYRGTRFDWSANIPELEYKGHSYCSQWFANYNATTHDAILGPVESFAPLGYDAATVGGHFVQIGVGVLTKAENVAYSPFKYYNISNSGNWKIDTKPNSIAFTHTLKDSVYSYKYTKTVTLVKDKAVMVIDHKLINTGNEAIETNVYNHNLFVLDKQPTGPDAVTSFPFTLTAVAESAKGFGEDKLAMLKDKQVLFNKVFSPGQSVYTLIQGYTSSNTDYDIKIENHHTGAALRITCDKPMSKLAFWASPTIFSPEPFIDVKVAPGETFNWQIKYELYTCAIDK
ncbi:MAG: hypothetical protein QM726_11710 [Chitinophagaceae bacterium]